MGIGLSVKLQKVQNRAACTISHSDTMLGPLAVKTAKLEDLSQTRICSKAIMMYKVLNDLDPNYLREKFAMFPEDINKRTLIIIITTITIIIIIIITITLLF